MLRNFLRTALRSLAKNASVSSLNIIGLSAGMTAAVFIFLWVQNELSFDSYHPNAERVYRITTFLPSANWTWETTPLSLGPVLTREEPGLETLTRMQPAYSFALRVNNTPFAEKHAAYVDSNWFKVFHYDFIKGSPADFFSQPYSLLMTQSKAKKYFGDKDPIGNIVQVDSVAYRVAAVVKDAPANSSFQADMLVPLDALLSQPDQRKNETSWGNFNFLTFLRLRPTASPATVAANITRIMKANRKDASDQMSLMPLTGMHFETGLTSGGSAIEHANRKTVYIFSILGVFLLVIACINYVNLTTARASIRAKEIGIRKIIGAGKYSLFLQFLFESFVISLLSLLITIALVTLLMPFFRDLTERHFTTPLTSAATWKVLGITLAAATVLNGIYPALMLSSFRPLNVLRGATILRFKDVYLRKGLVILQFTFSIILIIGTIVIQRQLSFIQHTDPGYQRSQVFYFRLPWNLIRQRTTDEEHASLLSGIKQQLSAQTGIASVTIASQCIVDMHSSNSGSADWDGHDTSYVPTVFQLSADEDYLKTLQLQMQQGRWFDPRNSTDKHNFILNETAINEFNIRKPVLGQRFTFQRDTGKIIGVVKDFHFASLHQKIGPLVFFNHDNWRSSFFIKTEPGKTAVALAAAQKIWQSFAPNDAFDYTFLDDQFDSLYKADSKTSTLILLFSIIAILISCLGLFALAAFTAQQRIKEIGIRKVLGATVPNIIALLSRDFVRLVLLSVLIATPIAGFAMHKWLEDFAYHIPLSVGVFIAAGTIALLVAIFTISTQSIRAATTNPIKNLRTE
jgi:putative ABC transport system permease protein